ncbi:GNAT family N-acetyltransferase [Streptomyces sp. NBC_01262]|uniref:GNAT family N-acetyltransferase n=1 Tax=Streptomyces sp. NBC_01262 TaxID=2903803 RepID=UPI002E322913|nr:GNAT family protein [Streptomyces sp. NBC_01262]
MNSMWVGRTVRLRAVEPEDWELFRSFELDSDVQRNGWRVQPPQSAEAAKAWAKERTAEPKAGEEGFTLAIESLDEGVLVGSVSTHHVALPCGRFDYGIALGPEHHRRGYASDAVRLLLAFMFRERRFHKCEASAWSFNDASIAFHLNFGFTQEGRLRDHDYANGQYHDEVLFGMTAEEFAKLYPVS